MHFLEVGLGIGDGVLHEVDDPAAVHEKGQPETAGDEEEPREKRKTQEFPKHKSREDPALERANPATAITHVQGDAVGKDRLTRAGERQPHHAVREEGELHHPCRQRVDQGELQLRRQRHRQQHDDGTGPVSDRRPSLQAEEQHKGEPQHRERMQIERRAPARVRPLDEAQQGDGDEAQKDQGDQPDLFRHPAQRAVEVRRVGARFSPAGQEEERCEKGHEESVVVVGAVGPTRQQSQSELAVEQGKKKPQPESPRFRKLPESHHFRSREERGAVHE